MGRGHGGPSVRIPAEKVPDYLIARVLSAGMCLYPDLETLNLHDLFQMHDYLDLMEWVEIEKHEQAEKINRAHSR